MGGTVRKGEHGTPVIFWKIYEKEDAQAEDSKKRLPVLRYYTVFNVEQCDGITIPPVTEGTGHEHDPIEAAETVALTMPNRPWWSMANQSLLFAVNKLCERAETVPLRYSRRILFNPVP